MDSPLLRGIDLPPALGRGRPNPAVIESWLHVTERLMGRGVTTPTRLSKVCGVAYRTADRWLTEVRRRWATGLSDDRINWRREKLYAEADEVARAAWSESMQSETPSEKASLFKVVLMANARKAALTGLDTMEIRVHKRVEHIGAVDLVARVEHEHGLAPGALADIGRRAALVLSKPTETAPALSHTPHPTTPLPLPPFSEEGSENGLESDTPIDVVVSSDVVSSEAMNEAASE